ncbi:MAG TPA: hypothetical protein VFU64_04995 [Gaiellaceae bacterium]|nr:hypothetical protein [Gaiellaceae bacterium]
MPTAVRPLIVVVMPFVEIDPTTLTVKVTESTLVCDQDAVALKRQLLSMLSVGTP